MFKNVHPTGTLNLNAGFVTAYAYFAADANGNPLFWYVGFSQFVNLVIMVLSYGPFAKRYQYEVIKREETEQEANEYGCVDGVDENGDECEPSYDAEDSTCVDGVDENGDECEPSYDAEDSTCVDGLDEDGLDC